MIKAFGFVAAAAIGIGFPAVLGTGADAPGPVSLAANQTIQSEASSGSLNVSTSSSSNWTGISTTGIVSDSVRATWVTPSWSGEAQPGSSVGDWVGLGGSQSKSLIQVGTVTTANAEGAPVTQAFWENLPGQANMGVTIPQGDRVTAQLAPDGTDSWLLEVTSANGSKVWLQKVVHLKAAKAKAVQTSADVIAEEITGAHGLIPLAPFGSTTFTGIHLNGQPLGSTPVQNLTADVLVGGYNQPLAAAYYSPSHPDAMNVEENQTQAPIPVGYPSPGYGYGYGGGYGYGDGGGYGYGYGGGFGGWGWR